MKDKNKTGGKSWTFPDEVENVRKYVDIQTIVFVSILCKIL